MFRYLRQALSSCNRLSVLQVKKQKDQSRGKQTQIAFCFVVFFFFLFWSNKQICKNVTETWSGQSQTKTAVPSLGASLELLWWFWVSKGNYCHLQTCLCSSILFQPPVVIFKICKYLAPYYFKLPQNLEVKYSLKLTFKSKATISILEHLKSKDQHSLLKRILLAHTAKDLPAGWTPPHLCFHPSSNNTPFNRGLNTPTRTLQLLGPQWKYDLSRKLKFTTSIKSLISKIIRTSQS